MNISLSVIVGAIMAGLGILVVIAVFIPLGLRDPFSTPIELGVGVLLVIIGVVIARGGLPHATG